MVIKNKDLKRRLVEISYKHKLSHLGSVLTAVDIIDEIYSIKKHDEPFILSCGHAGLALYCVIEKYCSKDIGNQLGMGIALNAEKIFKHHGVHPDRCKECQLDCSAGSLGNGLPIAVGMALADRSKNVYCLISDGECSEGSIWEALRIAQEQKLNNLKVYCNFNGWGAYKSINSLGFGGFFAVDIRPTFNELPFLKGQDAHYYTMNEEDYKVAMEVLK